MKVSLLVLDGESNLVPGGPCVHLQGFSLLTVSGSVTYIQKSGSMQVYSLMDFHKPYTPV